jgi:glycosyltransferase involved in cell wall biosynthesis
MLSDRGFLNLRIWPRGIDTSLFNTSRRDVALRREWGAIVDPPATSPSPLPSSSSPGDRSSLPLPYVEAVGSEKIVLLYVGRLSWEKNLRLLLEAFKDMPRNACRLVFVGDGPARKDAERICKRDGLDATFMGHQTGVELAKCFASADLFAFPSWTETFVGFFFSLRFILESR